MSDEKKPWELGAAGDPRFYDVEEAIQNGANLSVRDVVGAPPEQTEAEKNAEEKFLLKAYAVFVLACFLLLGIGYLLHIVTGW